MAKVSQFKRYSYSDVGAPALDGMSGSLIRVFDACLVDGYGTQTPAGWSKPFSETGSVWGVNGSGSVVATYQQPSGSKFYLFINDCKPSNTAAGKEAWATGWEFCAGTSASFVGSGSGQFPTAAQLLTTGHTVIRKSAAATTAVVYWEMYADEYTFYFFAQTGDVANAYYCFWFGDVYSIKNSEDRYKCTISGRALENSVVTSNGGQTFANWGDTFDGVGTPGTSTATFNGPFGYAQAGVFIARTVGGTGTSVAASKGWDISKGTNYTNSTLNNQWLCSGVIQSPNSPDNSIYIDPIYIGEPTAIFLRGRFRGIYHICHLVANFYDGQVFWGAGDYAGKSFRVIKGIGQNSTMFAIETSNTVETNDELS